LRSGGDFSNRCKGLSRSTRCQFAHWSSDQTAMHYEKKCSKKQLATLTLKELERAKHSKPTN
jgi:ribosomal protein L34E